MARAKKSPRGERRYEIVKCTKTGETLRVLTSVAAAGYALIEHVPSNEHLSGKFGGRMLTHAAITRGVIFNDLSEAAAHVGRQEKMVPGIRYTPATVVRP